ncbi:MAG: RNA-binding transcriptional accessory protein [Candidatus Omnitrophica bacterium]|nr:RNA-binding transcriptional accessory protein [Candidatus Omnitrophota bacterium]MCG2704180.1 RNA-binding transcriptional accessory protein [Candidatus Omnitrophota bacterium]
MDRNEFIIKNIVKDLNLKDSAVRSVAELIREGATIPFIARYRKEKTNGLDEVEIRNISQRLEYFNELEKRKETILKTIESQGKLTPELKDTILGCVEKNRLEDLYLPYKPKRTTRATIAREKGLQALADIIFAQKDIIASKEDVVLKYVNPEKGVNSYEEALQGALDIIAENIADTESIRGWIRKFFREKGDIVVKPRKEWKDKKSKFENYYAFSQNLKKTPAHRMLAIRRGANEEVLSWSIAVDEEQILDFMDSAVIRNDSFLFKEELKKAVRDSYKRLLAISIEVEVFVLKMTDADQEAIKVFETNLKNLLLAPPAGGRPIIGIDPGFRTGCKVAVIDAKGDFKEYKPIYPHETKRKSEAEEILLAFINRYEAELISIGNGTASKETDIFVRDILKRHNLSVKSVVVNEAGASVYSASEAARAEFPDLDVTVRGAISIARRLQDPLAELVKIDPKSIGVGQYQHDVNQKELKKSLELVVESCVNYVGVELNTASCELLSYVSGINKTVAENIVKYRTQNSAFKTRRELKDISRLSPRVFEQCAGFLRIRGSEYPLDNSAIHPEAYNIVEKMAKDKKIALRDIIGNDAVINSIDITQHITEEFGAPTLTDILKELRKPGLDPRKEFESIEFSAQINSITDLKQGMNLCGKVTNVTNFGAFVDIGVHQDGLIHISRLSSRFVRDPHKVVCVGDTVKVTVLDVDVDLKRISLERVE